MKSPRLHELPQPPSGRHGWPWTEESTPLSSLRQNGSPWPRISLVTPCHNSGAFLEESIRSVLLQGYPDIEYIIMDARSTDNSSDIIQKYAPWLSYWESKSDRGQSHAINKGLAKASGIYFNWHNADDILLPGSLAETVLGFDQFPDAVYLARYRLLQDESGTITPKRTEMPARRIEDRDTFVVISGGSQPGGLMLREKIIVAGGIDEELDCCMDEDLQLRLLIDGPAYFLKGPGFIFRVRAEQKSEALTLVRVREKLRIWEKLYDRLPKNDPRHTYRTPSRRFIHKWAAQLLWRKHFYLHSLRHALWAIIFRVLP